MMSPYLCKSLCKTLFGYLWLVRLLAGWAGLKPPAAQLKLARLPTVHAVHPSVQQTLYHASVKLDSRVCAARQDVAVASALTLALAE
jgi:hypothetical protein